MRTVEEVAEFEESSLVATIKRCPKCHGEDDGCECQTRHLVHKEAFEACVPRDFWNTQVGDVQFNTEAFNKVIQPYVSRLRLARRKGYGLMLLGDNGVGKTMFMSWVLMGAIRRGFTTYYTTLPQLDWDIKLTFSDKTVAERLQWLLSSDFLAIDEMGKEKFKVGDHFMRTQVERILKSRFDDSLPTLIATNANMPELEAIYGATITSILTGKYAMAMLEPGDYRERLRERMVQEMGFR